MLGDLTEVSSRSAMTFLRPATWRRAERLGLDRESEAMDELLELCGGNVWMRVKGGED